MDLKIDLNDAIEIQTPLKIKKIINRIKMENI